MSTGKIIFMVILVCVILFIALIIYTLSPTIRNVSHIPALNVFLNKTVVLKRDAFIHATPKGHYDFIENVLTDTRTTPGTLLLTLRRGDVLTIRKFKTYRSNLGSGFTHLYAIVEVIDKHGNLIEAEYLLGSVEKEIYATEPYFLHTTLWQDSTDQRIELRKP